MKRAVLAALLIAGAFLLEVATRAPVLPAYISVHTAYTKSDALLLDRRGRLLHEGRLDRRRRRLDWTPLAAVAPPLKEAVLAAEDQRFYHHGGVDWTAAFGAASHSLSGHGWRGASTITMQLAALLELQLRPVGRHRGVLQKLRQMRAAHALEQNWSKDEILEAYLNLVSFRGELGGISAATRGLYGKEPHGLGSSESLLLAALIALPSASPSAAAKRSCQLAVRIGLGAQCSELTKLARSALGHPYVLSPHAKWAPQVAKQLFAGAPARSITTTLDLDLQRHATAALREQLLHLSTQHVHDGAVLVVDNASGEVLAYVGNGGKLASGAYVDGVRAPRQAGSTLKPFLYGLALNRRLLTLASRLADTPIDVPTPRGLYHPGDYDHKYHGLVTARVALASSLNAPAVRTLLLVGESEFAGLLKSLGFSSVELGHDYGPSLALGTADVSLWELVNAYRTLARGGLYTPLHLRADEERAGEQPVFSADVAFLLGDTLADRASRALTFGLESPLGTRFWTAVKTGTSKDMRDNWCVGYSSRYTVGVWVGNFSGAPMWNVSGISGAAPIWTDIMRYLHGDLPSPPPAPPSGVYKQELACKECPGTEYFLTGTEPSRAEAYADASPARIIYPAANTVLAVDPDIPAANQRVVFEATRADASRWSLDGTLAGQAHKPWLWRPTGGAHILALISPEGRILDHVRFTVKAH